IGLILHGVVGILCRVVILYYQEFGRRSQGAIDCLTVASFVRDMLFAYGTTVTFMIAIDRFIATHYWSWYERQSRSTLNVAILLLLFAEAFTVTTACFSIFRVYALLTHYLVLGAMLTFGTVCFLSVYRHNTILSERYRMKVGLTDYSVSRTYQIKENIVLYKIAHATVLFVTPAFILFGFYYSTETFSCLDLPRQLAIAIFDLWIAIYVVIIEWRLVTADERFERGLRTVWGFRWLQKQADQKPPKNSISTIDNGDFYFTQFNRDWKQVMMDPVSTLIANSDDVDELLEFMLYDFLHEPSLNASINLTIEDAEQ
ncbi:hypothetical protein PENTCL1PPCAC_16218, partial [Pristionchus entomophagus]